MNQSFIKARVVLGLQLSVMLLLCFAFASPALADNDHTVLYYLTEMHRQHGKKCSDQGGVLPANLSPSEPLRQLAIQGLQSPENIQAILTNAGFAQDQSFAALVQGAKPQDALDQLKANFCRSIENPQFKYIGAAHNGNTWQVVLSSVEPSGAVPNQSGGPAVATGAGAAQSVSVSNTLQGNSNTTGAGSSSGAGLGGAAGVADPGTMTTPQSGAAVSSSFGGGVTEAPGGAVSNTREVGAAAAVIGAGQVGASSSRGPASSFSGGAGSSNAATPNLYSQSGDAGTIKLTGVNPVQQPDMRPNVQSESLTDVRPPQPSTGGTYPGNTLESSQPGSIGTPTDKQAGIAPGTDPIAQALSESGVPQTSPVGSNTASGQGSSAYPTAAALPSAEFSPGQSALTEEVLQAINRARETGAMCGSEISRAEPLHKNNALATVAAKRVFSNKEAQGTDFAKFGNVGDMAREQGYNWSLVGENIGFGQHTPNELISAFFRDPQQCKNLMNPSFTEIGIAHSPELARWSVILGRPTALILDEPAQVQVP